MKILVIQLARYGDLILTTPIIRSLRRKFPSAELHVLVREKFYLAVEGVSEIDSIHQLSTKQILEPTIESHKNIEKSLTICSDFFENLAQFNFDRIYNLSFSPLSSYITSFISHEGTDIRGYSRFSDGYLNIKDDASAYFYGQVGVGRHNRVHLTEIFASVADVDLEVEDFRVERGRLLNLSDLQNRFNVSDLYVVIHIGASEEHKMFSPQKWVQVIRKLITVFSEKVVLVGSAVETEIGEEVALGVCSDQLVNLVGKTSFAELISLVDHARFLVGADSLPVQISSMTQTKCLNLSFSTVNFWETGPLAPKSRVLYAFDQTDMASDTVATELFCMIDDEASKNPVFLRNSEKLVSFEAAGGAVVSDKLWNYVEALYMEADFQTESDPLILMGFQRLYEVSTLALEQLPLVLESNTRESAVRILNQVDMILLSIEKMVPPLQPVLSWIQTERIRIGPGSLEEVTSTTIELFNRLKWVAKLYAQEVEQESVIYHSEGGKDANQKMV